MTGTVDAIVVLATKQFGMDAQRIDIDAPLDTLGADSLAFLEFLFELEEHFDVTIDQEAAASVHSVRELGALIDRLRSSGLAAVAES